MALQDVALRKTYKNGSLLFAEDLDVVRTGTEDAFQTVNLNLTQLRKDLFLTTYDYDNDGNSNLSTSLQDQINLLAGGGTPITGTSSSTFTINSGGNSITFSASLLSDVRTYNLPDRSGTIATLEGNQVFTGTNIIPMLVPGQVQNLSWTKSAGTITIADGEGNALSATNPGWVCVPSAVTSGTFKTLKVTANVTFNDDDHASSDLTGWLFGVTTGVAWNTAMPFFIRALNKDDTDSGLVFGISRSPASTYFETADIGDKDAVSANNDQDSIFVADSITEADYNLAPNIVIGAFEIKKTTAADDWSVTAPQACRWGFGQYNIDFVLNTTYTFPTGQNGAASGTYIDDNGGTAPVFTTNNYNYTLSRDGICTCYISLNGDGGTDGAGAVTTRLRLPYINVMSFNTLTDIIRINNTTVTYLFQTGQVPDGQSYYAIEEEGGTNTQNQDFGSGGRSIAGTLRFKAY